jgi:hypothetical protein
MTDLGRGIARGALAGVAGTTAMTVAMTAAHADATLGMPPPHAVSTRLLGRMGLRPRRFRHRAATSVVAHFLFGAGLGGAFGLVRALVTRRTRVPIVARATTGAAYGPAIWALMYGLVLPRAGLFPHPSRDRRRQRALAAAHLVYGAVLGALA